MSHMGVQDSQDIVVSSHISISENTTKLMDKVGMGIRLHRLLFPIQYLTQLTDYMPIC